MQGDPNVPRISSPLSKLRGRRVCQVAASLTQEDADKDEWFLLNDDEDKCHCLSADDWVVEHGETQRCCCYCYVGITGGSDAFSLSASEELDECGFYHLFYQHNPTAPVFYPEMYWGHSVSRDLVNWTPLELAFAPDQVFDIYGCWSGSATILPGNKLAMLYTGIDSKFRQVQNFAVPKNLPDPYLREWVRYKGNPVKNLPGGIRFDSFRDPTTGWLARDGIWRTLVASVVLFSFGGGRNACITARVYPTLAIRAWSVKKARQFAFNNGTESVVISELKAWSVKKARINI